jgi:cytoskeletal protein CcmA (bactofilin family)
MREERGQVSGNVDIDDLYTLWGSIAGNVRVLSGGKFYLRGTIYGNLLVDNGGRCHIWGNLKGNLEVMPGSKVIHSGLISGDAINRGGRLYIESCATVGGRVKTIDGKTQIDKGATLAAQD